MSGPVAWVGMLVKFIPCKEFSENGGSGDCITDCVAWSACPDSCRAVRLILS